MTWTAVMQEWDKVRFPKVRKKTDKDLKQLLIRAEAENES